MKKILMVLVVCLIFAPYLQADPFEDFKTHIKSSLLKPFTEDFGGLVGANDFNTGRTVSFPGFDVSLGGVVQFEPNDDNLVLKNAGVDTFGIAMAQGSIGIPVAGIDAVLRGTSIMGLNIIGGGVRYSFHRSGLAKFIPDVMLSAFYDTISYDYFEGSHYSFDVSASFDLPIIKPYAGIGYDRTKLEIKDVSALLNGVDASVGKMRFTVGTRLTPFPFLYLYGAYSLLHSNNAAQFGVGINF